MFALDFDAACLTVGLDQEKRVRESRQPSTTRTIKHVMGR